MKLEVKTEELQKQRLFIGTPMYGGQCAGLYTKSTNDLSMLCSSHKIPMKYYFLFNESLVQRARNYIVDEFLRSDCTHLLFIDSDIGFDPRDGSEYVVLISTPITVMMSGDHPLWSWAMRFLVIESIQALRRRWWSILW